MLVAHHIIDALRGKDKRGLFELPNVSTEDRLSTADLISKAMKFDFGNIHLEPRGDGVPGHFSLPALSDDEREWWCDGLIPLPFPVVWYEFTLGTTARSGLLVRTEEDGQVWVVDRIDSTSAGVLYEAIRTMVDRRRSRPGEDLRVAIAGNVELYQSMQAAVDRGGHDGLELVLKNNIGIAPIFAIYLTLMITSRTTEIAASERPPERLNKKRLRAGKAPLEAHRIVTIVPERYRVARDPGAPKSPGTPRRLHWRRSHLRHFDHNTPKAVWSPTKIHEGRTGWWVLVVPRCLVGRAELGEVSHEYRVGETKTPTLQS